jgi:hypothetical protein
MPKLTATLVVTTISDGAVLDTYRANLERYGHLGQVEVIVVPDRKTPGTAFTVCSSLNKIGLKVRCPSIEEQEAFLRSVGLAPHMIPYDSDNRRNVGFLMALASGADLLISIDDDNYCIDKTDYFAEHAVVCTEPAEHTSVESATGFLNICDLLEFDKPILIYPRGFPYFARHKEECPKMTQQKTVVQMNAGLWALDPDIDSISWLVAMPHAQSFKGKSLLLARNTWTAINTQNTALSRDVIPSYYFIKMRHAIAGVPIDRYGDIFSGYFAQACVKHLGGSVRVGTPVAAHKRNRHNYLTDATNEWACILVLEDLLPWLREAKLCGSSYSDSYLSLSHAMEDVVEQLKGTVWTDMARGYFHQMGYYMRAWLKACGNILGS